MISISNSTANLSPEEFTKFARLAHEKGWCPVPVGKPVEGKPAGKAPWLKRLTGHSGIEAEPAQFERWPRVVASLIRKHDGGVLNLATRMPVGVVGLDVDAYPAPDGTEKRGLAALAELEARFGLLPPTIRITARGFDNGSGIKFFRIPDEWIGPTELKMADGSPGDIELIQRHHRVAVLPPSVHHTGKRYRAFDERTGKPCELWSVDELPNLPDAWLDALRRTSTGAGGNADAKQIQEFTRTHTADHWPSLLKPVVENVQTSTATRNSMRDALCQSAREARAGCYPFSRAVDELRTAAEQSYAARGRTLDGTEYAACVAYAVSVAAAEPYRELRRRVARAKGFASPTTLRLAERVISPGGGIKRRRATPEDKSTVTASWLPVDVHAARLGQTAAPPAILARADGACLLYRGKVHSVHGESESGKSWLVQCAAAETLLSGEAVLYVDFEDDAGPVAERLVRLGVPEAIVDNPAIFSYIKPEASPTSHSESKAFARLLSQCYSLAVIDGVTDAMGLFGLSGKDNDDVAAWQRQLPRAIARATGAAVVCVDHVSKDPDTRGRFALGGQHKMAGLDGAALIVEMAQPFAVGLVGMATVRVGKDRPGQIRNLGGRWRKKDRTQLIANFRLDSTDTDYTRWSLDLPNAESDDDEENSGSAAVFRPTWCMERVSRYWEETDDLTQRTATKTQKALNDEQGDNGRRIGRDTWRAAIERLVTEGYATFETGERKSHLHTVVRPYRQANDPDSDRHVAPSERPRKVRVQRRKTEPKSRAS